MKAIRLNAVGAPLALEDVATPEPALAISESTWPW